MQSGIRSVALLDLDGTITRGDTYLAYLRHVLSRRPYRVLRCLGLPIHVAKFGFGRITNSALKSLFLRAVLGGLRRDEIERHTREFIERRFARLVKPAALERIEWHRTRGDELLLVSASLDVYAIAIGAALGFDAVICTRAAWDGDRLAGGLEGPNLLGDAKVEAVRRFLDAEGGSRHVTAYSDHHSDLPLLRFADVGIAVDPTSRLGEVAAAQGLCIETWAG
jgi:phosphatidylglycerophosphatase C